MMTFLINVKNWEWSDIFTITLVGYSVVFLVLVLLIYVYKLMPVVLNYKKRKSVEPGGAKMKGTEAHYVAGEVNAAIAMSLILYFNEQQHDDESNVITIKRVARTYSPWSSKIYSVNNVLR